jgi:hypothetical protein
MALKKNVKKSAAILTVLVVEGKDGISPQDLYEEVNRLMPINNTPIRMAVSVSKILSQNKIENYNEVVMRGEKEHFKHVPLIYPTIPLVEAAVLKITNGIPVEAVYEELCYQAKTLSSLA